MQEINNVIPNAAAPVMRKKRQRGFALLELVLAVAVVGVLAAIGTGVYSAMNSGIKADDQANKTITMASAIQKNWRNSGGYATVTGAELNKLSLIAAPLRFDTPNVVDAFGNPMIINGGAASFAITTGGTAGAIGPEDCATIANKLASIAHSIRIGVDATAAGGVISGGHVFKSGTTYTQANLGAGCEEAGTVIAAQFR